MLTSAFLSFGVSLVDMDVDGINWYAPKHAFIKTTYDISLDF